ncbi:hypothetical protein OHA98_42365 [Streptomyces sp. NBC_00654]|uniref:hypothetical protein n=1 Tax=Streptomyces sp. NBC_00654 TaxID=2975799 RepID=UPI002251A06F|nr:hypothetical protein [Streptomyces sp. NBC_00654]MCX4971246.1 hypothetical protein [Streptomyces sp. NBC_00654]
MLRNQPEPEPAPDITFDFVSTGGFTIDTVPPRETEPMVFPHPQGETATRFAALTD